MAVMCNREGAGGLCGEGRRIEVATIRRMESSIKKVGRSDAFLTGLAGELLKANQIPILF